MDPYHKSVHLSALELSRMFVTRCHSCGEWRREKLLWWDAPSTSGESWEGQVSIPNMGVIKQKAGMPGDKNFKT